MAKIEKLAEDSMFDQPLDGLLYDLDLLPEQNKTPRDKMLCEVVSNMHAEIKSLTSQLAAKGPCPECNNEYTESCPVCQLDSHPVVIKLQDKVGFQRLLIEKLETDNGKLCGKMVEWANRLIDSEVERDRLKRELEGIHEYYRPARRSD